MQSHNIQLTSVQFPGTNYPGSEVPYAVAGAQFNQTSPPYYPSPWGTGAGEWTSAYEKAIAFVSKLTLAEKVNLTTGMFFRSTYNICALLIMSRCWVSSSFIWVHSCNTDIFLVGNPSSVSVTLVPSPVWASSLSVFKIRLWVSDSVSNEQSM
jgi:hypothetical protein